jgi:hypothetical protein
MSTTTDNAVPETQSFPQRRRLSWLAIFGLAPVIFCTGCLFLYIATSPCSLAAQWYDLTGPVPTVLLPPDVVRLSARAGDKPILGVGQADADLYGELYSSATAPDTIVAFYQARGATCDRKESGSAAFWSCDLVAPPAGSGRVDILSQAAYRIKPDSHDVGIESYHLQRPIPNEGTILRTWVVWCVDR